MRIHEDARGAMGNDCHRVLADAYHGRFHMYVRVHEARSDILSGCVDHLGVIAYAV